MIGAPIGYEIGGPFPRFGYFVFRIPQIVIPLDTNVRKLDAVLYAVRQAVANLFRDRTASAVLYETRTDRPTLGV